MFGDAYKPGDRVVTRRGKHGEVTQVDADGVHVRFGGPNGTVYPMRSGQLVTESAYESMQRGAAVLASNQRYNQRSY